MSGPVVLTGGTGFVGSHLAEALRARHCEVRALLRDRARGGGLESLGCALVEGGLDDARLLARLVEGADTVFHVAGALSGRSEAELRGVNGEGSARLAEASVRAGVRRLVYVSSLAVTGPAARGSVRDEAGEPRPLTPYGRSKRAGEEAVRASGASFTIVRPPVVYGPRDRQVLRLFRLARRGVVPLLGDGGQELSLVHATDLAEALLAAGASAATAGGTYHAAHPAVVTQEALVRSIGQAVGGAPRTVHLPAAAVRPLLALTGSVARLAGRTTLLSPDKAPEFLAAAWTCSSAALERDAGWRARIALADGLRDTARWYAAEGWL